MNHVARNRLDRHNFDRVIREDIGVVRRPGVCGGRAVIDGTRLPIRMFRKMADGAVRHKLSIYGISDETTVRNVIRYWRVRGDGPWLEREG